MDGKIRKTSGKRVLILLTPFLGGRPCGQWKPMALTQKGSEDRIHEPGRAWLSRSASQIDRIVDHRRGRHAIQVEQLVHAQAEDGQDFFVHPGSGTSSEVCNEMIERALPPQGPGHDLSRERSIPCVIEGTAALREGRRQIESAGRDRAQCVIGGRACRRGHGAPSTAPARTGRPARKSRAPIGRRPSGWSSTMASTPAPPVAM